MKRRHFLRNGLWVAAAPFILVPTRGLAQLSRGRVGIGKLDTFPNAPTPAASCNTARDNNGSSASATYAFPQFGNICLWTPIAVTANYSVCRIDLTVASVTGLPTWTWTAAIWDMSAGKPSSINGTASAVTAATSGGVVSFTGVSSNPLSSGTTYAIVYTASASDNSNYVNIQAVGSFSAGLSGYSTDCATWTDTSLNFPLQNTLYSQ